MICGTGTSLRLTSVYSYKNSIKMQSQANCVQCLRFWTATAMTMRVRTNPHKAMKKAFVLDPRLAGRIFPYLTVVHMCIGPFRIWVREYGFLLCCCKQQRNEITTRSLSPQLQFVQRCGQAFQTTIASENVEVK